MIDIKTNDRMEALDSLLDLRLQVSRENHPQKDLDLNIIDLFLEKIHERFI